MKIKKITSDCEIEINESTQFNLNNSNVIINYSSKNSFLYFSSMINSNITINISGEVVILFFGQNESCDSKIKINFLTPKSRAIIREISIINNELHNHKDVEINHLSNRCFSDYKYFGYATDKSSIKISVKTVVPQNIIQTDAAQKIRLLTNKDGSVEGKPLLLIDNYNTKASHGNSIGQINDKVIYYMQTKGIDRKTAKWLVIKGYIYSFLEMFDEDKKKEYMNNIKKILNEDGS